MSEGSQLEGHDDSMTEWEKCRELLADFDERTHDLRKYGFSFVTALLTTQALLIPVISTDPNNVDVLPDAIKLGVLIVTLGLIITLRFFERIYSLYRQAAATRAMVLERILNLELTDTITSRYRSANMPLMITGVYWGFAFLVLILGIFIVPSLAIWVIISSLIAIFILWGIMLISIDIGDHGLEDWSIDRQECVEGDVMRIFLTNLDNEKLTINKDATLWQVESEEQNDEGKPRIIYSKSAGQNITIGPRNTQVWIWCTNGISSGIYQIRPSKWDRKLEKSIWSQLRGEQEWKYSDKDEKKRILWEHPLKRKITICPNGKREKSKIIDSI